MLKEKEVFKFIRHRESCVGWGGDVESLQKSWLHLNHNGTQLQARRTNHVGGGCSYTSCWGELMGPQQYSGWTKASANDVSNIGVYFFNPVKDRKAE